ncbi:MAG: HAD family hydrolase [Eubacteriales bacterium]|nr:HAD family hydrolase [Eubacteriales bacterium]
MYRLIASDMDETLLDRQGRITPRTLRAVRRCMEAGALFSLSSGRMLEAMREQAKEIGVNAPMIMFNGAMIYDMAAEKTLFQRAIPADTARKICRMAEEMNLYIQTYPGEGYFCPERIDLTFSYEKRIRVQAQEVHMPLSKWVSQDAVKLLALGHDAQEIQQAMARFKEAFPQGVNFMCSHPTYLEIVAQGIDKGQAMDELAKAAGVDRAETLAFGDGQNDIPMLLAAGTGYAMADSAAAKIEGVRIAPPFHEDGVAQVLEDLLDQGLIGRG